MPGMRYHSRICPWIQNTEHSTEWLSEVRYFSENVTSWWLSHHLMAGVRLKLRENLLKVVRSTSDVRRYYNYVISVALWVSVKKLEHYQVDIQEFTQTAIWSHLGTKRYCLKQKPYKTHYTQKPWFIYIYIYFFFSCRSGKKKIFPSLLLWFCSWVRESYLLCRHTNKISVNKSHFRKLIIPRLHCHSYF